MGKYLLVLAVTGVYIYMYMDLPRDLQAATQYEIVQLHNPLMPLPVSELSTPATRDRTFDQAKVLLVASPAPETIPKPR